MGVIGSAVLHLPILALYSLMFYLVYNDIVISFPNLPAMSFYQWVPVSLCYMAFTLLRRPDYPASEAEAEYMKQQAAERFKARLKWILVIILIAWAYGLVYWRTDSRIV